MKKIKSYAIALLLLIGLGVHAQVPKAMKPARLVNDYANTFSSAERQRLEQKLVRFDSETSTQIAIVTMKDLSGYAPQDMATRIMEEWGVGGKDNNGVVILFKPKTASSNGEVFITTGYGVEQYVTDALAKKIVEYDMIPHFKNGDIYKGFEVATSSLISLTKGEFTGTQYLANRKKNAGKRSPFPLLFIIFFFIFPAIFGRRRRNMSSMSGRGSSLPFWLLLGSMGSGRSHGGSFGSFNSGGGSFGGFGGGFGGGGGAGGSW